MRKLREGITPLHATLESGLPDLCFPESKFRGGRFIGHLNIKAVGAALGVTHQSVHHYFKQGKLKRDHIEKILELSAASEHRPKGFEPLTREELWAFVK